MKAASQQPALRFERDMAIQQLLMLRLLEYRIAALGLSRMLTPFGLYDASR